MDIFSGPFPMLSSFQYAVKFLGPLQHHSYKPASLLSTHDTSERASYRLLRRFLNAGVRSFRCSSFPHATRCAGLARGPACRAPKSDFATLSHKSHRFRIETVAFVIFLSNSILRPLKKFNLNSTHSKIQAFSRIYRPVYQRSADRLPP